MDPPIDFNTGSVQALLDRLRAAQSGSTTAPSPSVSQQQSQTTGYSPQNPADTANYASYGAYRNPPDPSLFSAVPSGSHPYQPSDSIQQLPPSYLPNYHNDLARSDSVQSLLTSLQNSRQRPQFAEPPQNQPQLYSHNQYIPPNAPYQQHPPPSLPPPSPRQQFLMPDQKQVFHQTHPQQHAEPAFPNFDHSPRNRKSNNVTTPTPPPTFQQPTAPPESTMREPSRSPVPPDFSRPAPISLRVPLKASSPVPITAVHDPYDEDYSVPLQADGEDPEDETSRQARMEKDARIAVEAEAKKEREAEVEQEAQRADWLHAERDTDEFVNMPFGRASAVVTQRLNEESVMRRLTELKEMQDDLEKRLWEKRLEIVKTHREKMNKAKEEAKKMDQASGDARVMKEKLAAQKALKQYYTSRCLPFYDDLHREHLQIMQQELGIPGLGRPEARRRNTAGIPGGAERPIAVDSDDESGNDGTPDMERDGKGGQEVADRATEEAREKALVRRRKIMGLIESIMADGLDE